MLSDMNRMLDKWKRSGPMRVVAGPVGSKAPNGIARSVVGEDEELLRLSKPFRLRGETLMEFHARTLVSAHELRTLSRDEIRRRVELADERNAEAGLTFEPFHEETAGGRLRPKQHPVHIAIDTWS